MRKLLLNSTALATAAAITAGSALADVSISAYSEFKYLSRSSQVTANDGTSFTKDSEIHFNFSNKTDSGLDIGYAVQLESDSGDSAIQESSISISGGFGKIVLGEVDSVGGTYAISAQDAVAEEVSASATSATVLTNTDITMIDADDEKISYHLPAMGGFTGGVSFADSGNTAGTDTTTFGFQYTMEAAGNTITLAGASGSTEVAGAADQDSQNLAIKVASGNLTLIAAQGTYEAADEDRKGTGIGASYTMSNGMVIGAYTFKSDDQLDVGEEYSKSGVEVKYSIASGLDAYINVDDYNYKIGTSEATTADSGTTSQLTIKASF